MTPSMSISIRSTGASSTDIEADRSNCASAWRRVGGEEILRIYLQNFMVLELRFVVTSTRFVERGKVLAGPNIFREKPDRLPKFGDGFADVPFFQVN